MLRVIFDTNIYGLLFKEEDSKEIEKKIIEDKKFIVYGYKSIRKELRNIPKINKISQQTRILLLNSYDQITGYHYLEHSIKITKLAKKYYNHYRILGGIYGWNTNIQIDFIIVACATYYQLDIVYSADNKTLLNKKAIKAYNHINLKENLRTPNFLKYSNLIQKYRKL